MPVLVKSAKPSAVPRSTDSRKAGADGGGGEGDGGGGDGDWARVKRRPPSVVGTGMLAARITGSHCGGHAAGWLASASLLATLDSVMCGRKAAQKAAATPRRTSTRKLGACFFACLG